MASVASEVSAVHHARPGHGLRGNTPSANQPDTGGFGALLDGSDDPAPAASAPSQPGAPDQPAGQSPQTAPTDPAQTPSQPANPTSTQAGGKTDTPSDSAPGRSASVAGKSFQPSVAANLGPAANPNTIGAMAAPDPDAVADASRAPGQATGSAGAAKVPNQHGGKTSKADTSDSGHDATMPGSDTTLTQPVAPTPQPVAVAIAASTVTASAPDDDGPDVEQFAAVGDAAKPPRWGGQVDGAADAASADSTPGGQSEAGSAETAGANSGTAATPQSGTSQASPNPSEAPAPNPFTAPTPESFAGRLRARSTAETNSATSLDHRSNQPAGTIADPPPQNGVPAARVVETQSAAPENDPSADQTQSAAPADPSSNSPAPDSLIAATNAPAPAVSNAAASQPAAPASTSTASQTVPIAGLAVAIASHAVAGKSRFDIRLDPPDLGRIDVRLDVDHDGKVTSHLVVERQETLDMLRRDAPQIERSLQQAGLKTSDALQFTLRDQGGFSQQNPYPRNAPLAGGTRIVVPDSNLPSVDTVKGRYSGITGAGGGIDIRV